MPLRPFARKARLFAAAFGLVGLVPVGIAQAATARPTLPATNPAVTTPDAAVATLTTAGALVARAMLLLGRDAASPLLLHPMSSRFPVGAATRQS